MPQHYVNLLLPNNVVMVGKAVAQLSLTGYDVILGMDIISEGDFAPFELQRQNDIYLSDPVLPRV